MKYKVLMSRISHERGYVEVEADSEAEAMEAAEDIDTEDIDWNAYDGESAAVSAEVAE